MPDASELDPVFYELIGRVNVETSLLEGRLIELAIRLDWYTDRSQSFEGLNEKYGACQGAKLAKAVRALPARAGLDQDQADVAAFLDRVAVRQHERNEVAHNMAFPLPGLGFTGFRTVPKAQRPTTGELRHAGVLLKLLATEPATMHGSLEGQGQEAAEVRYRTTSVLRRFRAVADMPDYLARVRDWRLPPAPTPVPTTPSPLSLAAELDFLDTVWGGRFGAPLLHLPGAERTTRLAFPAASDAEFDNRMNALREVLRGFDVPGFAGGAGRLTEFLATVLAPEALPAVQSVATLQAVRDVRNAGQHAAATSKAAAALRLLGLSYPIYHYGPMGVGDRVCDRGSTGHPRGNPDHPVAVRPAVSPRHCAALAAVAGPLRALIAWLDLTARRVGKVSARGRDGVPVTSAGEPTAMQVADRLAMLGEQPLQGTLISIKAGPTRTAPSGTGSRTGSDPRTGKP